jgi:pimeloyl-ACP methyl ester carboxylesterase
MIKSFSRLVGAYLNSLAHILPKTAGKQGFTLFCHPFRSTLKSYHKQFFNTADRFSFDHEGTTIQGYRWGTGPKKVLFLHGWQSHTFRWKNYIQSLPQEEYSIYAIDAPGHGLSKGSYLSVPYYSAVIQQLMGTLGHVHAMITHSVGGFSALHAFHEQPTISVDKLILMATPGKAWDFFQFYRESIRLSDKTVQHILEYFENEFKKPIDYFSTADFAKSLSLPGYIIHDEDDAEAPYHYAVKINENWKNSILITTKGLGHNIKSKDIVERVVRLISESTHNAVMEVSPS